MVLPFAATSRVLRRVGVRIWRSDILDAAAAMTYYGIFSLFPLMLLGIALTGRVLRSSDAAHDRMITLIVQLLPQGQDQLRTLVDGVIEANGTAAGIGAVTLLWAALSWFQVIDTNVNAIWAVEQSRSYLKRKLFALGMVLGVSGVALTSIAASAGVDLLMRKTEAQSGSELFWQTAISALSALTIGLLFFALYRYVPQRPVWSADVWPSALAAAVLWELSRAALALYLHATNMISAYGPIGSAMALLFWLYLTSLVILFGAYLAHGTAEERGHAPARDTGAAFSPGSRPAAAVHPDGKRRRNDESS